MNSLESHLFETVNDLADKSTKTLVKRVAWDLRHHGITIEGYYDDRSAWDVICIQLQSEPSRFWYTYEFLTDITISKNAARLEEYEKRASYFLLANLNTSLTRYQKYVLEMKQSVIYEERFLR